MEKPAFPDQLKKIIKHYKGKKYSLDAMRQADVVEALKVRKAARIRNGYNQVPHLSQDTKWESIKSQ